MAQIPATPNEVSKFPYSRQTLERSKRSDAHTADHAAALKRRKKHLILAGLVLFVLGVCAISLLLGRYPIAPNQALLMLVGRIFPLDQSGTTQQATLFFNVRLPRILLALLVGCCLSAAGGAFQGVFKNPLVSPDLLGASQGAALGAALALLFEMSAFAVSTSAFFFSILTVFLVLVISTHAKGNHALVVVLSGVMVSSLFSSGVSYIKLIADPTNQLPNITYWLMGSLNGAKTSDLLFSFPPMLGGLVVLLALRWRINVLTMGDDEAITMGVNVRRIRIVVMLAATVVTAASVAVTGMIGWVGLVIPHLSRMIIGNDYRYMMPASMLLGAGFMLIVDDFSRLMLTSEIPLSILTSLIGAPFFIYLITRKKQL